MDTEKGETDHLHYNLESTGLAVSPLATIEHPSAMENYTPQLPAAATSVEYAQSVVTGKIVAGKYVRLACKRFLNDLQYGEARGIYFDAEAADHAVRFFGFLRHTKGVWARKVETSGFVLSPWQVFCTANLFGWRKASDGTRRFREAHIEVARKNGKSTWMGGIGNYMLYADGEPGAEVYSAATTKQQAKIVFNAAKDQVRMSPFLASRVGVWRNNLHVDASSSKFEPLASDAGTLDGLNIHCALIDELHEHPDRTLYDVLNTATGSRTQPLILSITTAGFNREGICWDQRSYGVKVVSGDVTNDDFFVFIACLDPGDAWTDEKNWIKANPNLGVSVSLESIRPNFLKAEQQPAAQNEFQRKHLNIWTSNNTAWLVDGTWEKNSVVPADLAGDINSAKKLRELAFIRLKNRRCFGGLDLGETDDLTAYALVFPPCELMKVPKVEKGFGFFKMPNGDIKYLADANIDNLLRLKAGTRTDEPPPGHPTETLIEKDDKWSILPFFWIPEAFLDEKAKKNKVPYSAWHKAGFIEVTPGQSVSQEGIRRKILEVNNLFRVGEIGYDKFGAEWLGPKLLGDGQKMLQIPPRFEYLSHPTKNLTSFLVLGGVEHYNNPVLRWNASNVQLLLDSNGNQRPDKGKSKNKIDGIVATVMAMGRALANPTLKGADDPNHYKIQYI